MPEGSSKYRAYDFYMQDWVYTTATTDASALNLLTRKIRETNGKWKITSFQKNIKNFKGDFVWVDLRF